MLINQHAGCLLERLAGVRYIALVRWRVLQAYATLRLFAGGPDRRPSYRRLFAGGSCRRTLFETLFAGGPDRRPSFWVIFGKKYKSKMVALGGVFGGIATD